MICLRYNVVVRTKKLQTVAEQAETGAWRDLYLAVLFEADSAKLPKRIAKAEYALTLRERELWYSGGDHSENNRRCHARS